MPERRKLPRAYLCGSCRMIVEMLPAVHAHFAAEHPGEPVKYLDLDDPRSRPDLNTVTDEEPTY